MWTYHAEIYTLYLIHRSNASSSELSPQCSIYLHFPHFCTLEQRRKINQLLSLRPFSIVGMTWKMNENTFLFPDSSANLCKFVCLLCLLISFLLSHPLYSIRILADLTIMQSQTKFVQIFYLHALASNAYWAVCISKAVQGEIVFGLKKCRTSSDQEEKSPRRLSLLTARTSLVNFKQLCLNVWLESRASGTVTLK